jgi:hypothetical protein
MTDVVAHGHRFDQVFVETQCATDGAAQLAHLEGVRQTRPRVIGHVWHEHLCLVFQPSKCPRVENPVAVSLKREPEVGSLFLIWIVTPSCGRRSRCVGGQAPILVGLESLAIPEESRTH